MGRDWDGKHSYRCGTGAPIEYGVPAAHPEGFPCDCGCHAPTGAAPTVPGQENTPRALPEPQEPSPETQMAAIVDEAVRLALPREFPANMIDRLAAEIGLDVHERMLKAGLVPRYRWQVAEGDEYIALAKTGREFLAAGTAVFDSPVGAGGPEIEVERG